MVDGMTAYAVVVSIAAALLLVEHFGGFAMTFDIKAAENEARAELAAEHAKEAKAKIKGSLAKIAAARKIVANLEAEHAALMRDIGSE